MNNVDQTSIATLQVNSQNPYIGLESYREEYKEFFFGRSADIANLLKLIRNNPVTVLSGKSGLGKTSLINAGLVPELRKMDFLPIYLRLNFDDVEVGVLDQLKKIIYEECRKIDPSSPEFRNVSLWEYFHQLSLLRGFVEPVLIFDQFEELFTRGEFYDDRVKHFITELSNLIENEVPVEVQDKYEGEQIPLDLVAQHYRILISLREDYLARLETLSLTIPSLKKSRYRLLQMNADQALEAVLMPGREIIHEPEARQLLQFLFEEPNISQSLKHDIPEVEPFLLSLVCFQVNNRRKRRQEPHITSQLVEKIQVKNIIEEFYEKSVSFLTKGSRDLLEEKLLTADGFRKLQPKVDLVKEGHLEDSDIEKLIDKRILRKEIWSGREHLELIHDVLIPIIRKRKAELLTRQKKQKKLFYAGIAVIAIVALLLVGWRAHIKQAVEFQRTKGALEELKRLTQSDRRKQAEVVINLVASYLWSKGEEKSIQQLVSLMKEYEDLIPEKYGLIDQLNPIFEKESPKPTSGNYNAGTLPTGQTDLFPKSNSVNSQQEISPLTLVISKTSNISEEALLTEWKRMSLTLASSWGIPSPSSLKIERDDRLPKDQMVIRIPHDNSQNSENRKGGFIELNFEMQERPGHVLVSEEDVNKNRNLNNNNRLLADFFTRNKKDWIPITSLTFGGPWYLVPKWTQPIFKVAGHPTTSPQSGIAVALANRLLLNPESILNDDVIKILLERSYGKSPESVSEAFYTRGGLEGLKNDLIEIVKRRYSLMNLSQHLGFLSNYWKHDSDSAAGKAIRDQQKPEITFENLQGVREAQKSNLDSVFSSYQRLSDYSESLNYIKDQSEIRVDLGNRLYNLVVHDGDLRPEFLGPLEKLRAGVYYEFGIIYPQVLIYSVEALGDYEMVIECIHQGSADEVRKPVRLDSSSYLIQLAEEIKREALAHRIFWVDAEYVRQELADFEPNIKKFLFSQYTLTDLKQIFRGVISPTYDELEYRNHSHHEEAAKSIPQENTLFDIKWLMGSLVFWRQTAMDHLNLKQVRKALIQTQSARLQRDTKNAIAVGEMASLIGNGITYLRKDDITAAEESFLKAVRKNPKDATDAFLALYPDVSTFRKPLIEGVLERVVPPRVVPKPGGIASTVSLYTKEHYDLSLLLRDYKNELTTEDLNIVNLVLLHYNLQWRYYPDADKNINDLLIGYYQNKLSASHKYLTAYYCLLYNKQAKASPIRLELISKMLNESVSEFSENAIATIVWELVNLVQVEFNDFKWSADLLMELAKSNPKEFWVNYPIGHYLATARRELRYSEIALEQLARAKYLNAENNNAEQERLLAWINFAEGYAYHNLAKKRQNDNTETLARKGIKLLENIVEARATVANGRPDLIHLFPPLYGLYLINNEITKASLLIQRGVEDDPKNASYYLRFKFFTLIAQQKIQDASFLSENLHKENPGDQDLLFDLALGQILAGSEGIGYTCNKFFATSHEYKDYIRLLLYYHLAVSGNEPYGREILNNRWATIDPASWPKRMEWADVRVWRERLIGYYLGHVTEEELFEPAMTLEAFEKDPVSRLGFAFTAFQCEAFFYNALLKRARGDMKAFQENLKKATSTQIYEYYEYHMASYFLQTPILNKDI